MLKEYLPQPQGFPHAHCASVTLHGETLFCVWYVYNNEEYQQARLACSQYNFTRKRWSQASLILAEQGRSQGNPCVFSYEGELFVLFVLLEGHYWNSARLHMGRLNTRTMELEEVHRFDAPQGMMVRHRPLLNQGALILPAYDEGTNETILFSLKPASPELIRIGTMKAGPIQGDIIPSSGPHNEIMLVLRPTTDPRMVMRAHSPDGGKTFPFPAYPTPLPCPLSGIAALRDTHGHLFVAHNNTEEHKRTPLSLSGSTDDLKSLCHSMELQGGPGEFSYPSMLMDEQGRLHVVYTHNREKIGHFLIHEDELKALVTEQQDRHES